MFLHSGASLHGHEFSARRSSISHDARPLRNALVRPSFPKPMNRPPSWHSYFFSAFSSPGPATADQENADSSSDTQSRSSEPVVRFQVPDSDTYSSRYEDMSGDDGSVSNSESTGRRGRRRSSRKSSSYALALPPPNLRNKQRLIHIHPRLLLQVQTLSPHRRAKPVIDVYPSSAVSVSLIAPLLKRLPKLARIKRELGNQDIMLVRSDDYSANSLQASSDEENENMNSGDLLAILSPFTTEDKAEIILADGSTWLASRRCNGHACFYDFVSTNSDGKTITARWVGRPIIPKSTTTTPSLPASSPSPVQKDYKYTFSVIDPNNRRHPILAVLQNSSLEVFDSYTTVSQSAGRYPPTSRQLASPFASDSEDEDRVERKTKPVEDWQKNFISISAIWVALRHGWVPTFRPEDLLSHAAPVPTTPSPEGERLTRLRSLSNRSVSSSPARRNSGRRYPAVLRMHDQPALGMLARRTTSTGSALIQKEQTLPPESPTQSESHSEESIPKLNRRAFSGDWAVGTRRRNLAENVLASKLVPRKSMSAPVTPYRSLTSTAASSPVLEGGSDFLADRAPQSKRPVGPKPTVVQEHGTMYDDEQRADAPGPRERRQSFRAVGQWFRKLSGR